MKLRFKQRAFSWLDSYDIYDEAGAVRYTVKGALSWGHKLNIYDGNGNYVGRVKEEVLTWLPRFDLYLGETRVGRIQKEFSWLKPRYNIDMNGWTVQGDWMEWDYTIRDPRGRLVASVSKELWNWTDTYTLDVANPADALTVLMFVLAVDAEKCSRN